MRLITVGRSSRAVLSLNSEYVSAEHAEILLLDNGDILLTDKGSRNGTFLSGKRLEPNVDISIKRGDQVVFGDTALDWSRLPVQQMPDPRTTKGIYGIGSNFRNRYNLSGDTVSRFHATIKEMRNGKWYIQDHSLNGTTINGQKITPNQDVRIKHGDKIVCGSVSCINPVPAAFPFRQVGIIALIALLVCGVGLGIYKLIPSGSSVDPFKATVCVHNYYYITVSFDDNPTRLNFPKTWYYNPQTENIQVDDEDCLLAGTGTAFFISKDGLLVTNGHIARPWKHLGKTEQEKIKTAAINKRNAWEKAVKQGDEKVLSFLLGDDYAKKYIRTDDILADLDRCFQSKPVIKGISYKFGIQYPGRDYNSSSQLDLLHVEKTSDNSDVDLAIIRLDSYTTPTNIEPFDLDQAIGNPDKLSLNDSYSTVGYPKGDVLSYDLNIHKMEPSFSKLYLTKKPGEYQIALKGDITKGGQSGSPIYDDKYRLIGVLYATSSVSEGTTYACLIKYAQELHKINQNTFNTNDEE